MTLQEYLNKTEMMFVEFAERIQVNPSTVSLLARGKRKPSLELALKIEEATRGKVKASVWRKKGNGKDGR